MMLDEILAATRRRLPELRSRSDDIMRRASDTPLPPSFEAALTREGLAVIAEVKRRSPSRGDLAADLDPVDLAGRYAAGGAAAISVLTEPEYFSGSPDDLVAVAAGTGLPTLRKDFVLDPVQVWESRAMGAAGLLLIVAALDDALLGRLLEATREAGLDALVEVHTEDEARRALDAGACIVGVNNRDLGDFTVDLATAEKLAAVLVDVPVRVAESGIFTGADAQRMVEAGYDAVLVGEALVKAASPEALLQELRGLG